VARDISLHLSPDQILIAQIAAPFAAGLINGASPKPRDEYERALHYNEAVTMAAELLNIVVFRTSSPDSNPNRTISLDDLRKREVKT
jgi:hypothetical protein